MRGAPNSIKLAALASQGAHPIGSMTMTPMASRWLIAAVLALTAWRIIMVATNGFGLNFDEAQYWIWAQSPAFGYLSKPPLIAWSIAGIGTVCGSAEWCVRLPASLFHAVAAFFVAAAGWRLYGRRVGLWAGLAYASAPAIGFSSTVMTTDAPLLMFWTIALYGLIRALEGGRVVWWLVVGTACGFGLLSKYAMGYFVLGGAVLAAMLPDKRGWLRTRGPWIGALCAIIIVLPNLLWNAGNHFATFAKVGKEAGWASVSFGLSETAEFLVSQFGLAGPVLFAGFLWFVLRPRCWVSEPRDRLLVAFAVPVLALVAANGLFGSVQANWAAVAFPSLAVLVPAWWERFGYARLAAASLAVNLVILAAVHHYDAVVAAIDERLPERLDPFKQFRGRAEVGRRIATILRRSRAEVLLADTRWDFAEFGYYVRPAPRRLAKWNPSGKVIDHFDLTARLDVDERRPVLLVTRRQDALHVKAYFCDHRRIGRILVHVHPGFELSYSAHLLTGFRGYGQKLRSCGQAERPNEPRR